MTRPATPLQPAARPASLYQISPALRGLVGAVGICFTAIIVVALTRIAAGLAPANSALKDLAILIHVVCVTPAVPLGAWLMLSRKGTPRHKALGKLWVLLMVLTAGSAIFIREINNGSFSLIHLFVPLTIYGAYQAVATARRGDIAAHKRSLTKMYLGALVIPGLFAFLPGRVMGLGLFG